MGHRPRAATTAGTTAPKAVMLVWIAAAALGVLLRGTDPYGGGAGGTPIGPRAADPGTAACARAGAAAHVPSTGGRPRLPSRPAALGSADPRSLADAPAAGVPIRMDTAAHHPASLRPAVGRAADRTPADARVGMAPRRAGTVVHGTGADPSIRARATVRAAPPGSRPPPWGRCDTAPHRWITTPAGHGAHASRDCVSARASEPAARLADLPAWAARAIRHGRRLTPARLQVFRC